MHPRGLEPSTKFTELIGTTLLRLRFLSRSSVTDLDRFIFLHGSLEFSKGILEVAVFGKVLWIS